MITECQARLARPSAVPKWSADPTAHAVTVPARVTPYAGPGPPLR